MTRLLWLLIGLLAAGFAQAQEWEWVSPLPTGADLADVYFLNDTEGWAVGTYGTVIHTTDGGMNWERLHVGGGDEFFKVQFVDSQTGWALGRGGNNTGDPHRLYKTSDAGFTWVVQFDDTTITLTDLAFTDFQRVLVVGYHYNAPSSYQARILRTTDGGDSWAVQAFDTLEHLVSVDFFGDSVGWAATVHGRILRTSDAGVNWALTPSSGTSVYCADVDFSDALNGWMLANNTWDCSAYHTSDGGVTWTGGVIPNTQGSALQVVSMDSLTCFAITSRSMHRTEDGGLTWTQVLTRPYANHWFALAARGDLACVVSAHGAIFTSADAGDSWTDRRQSLFSDPDADLKAVSFINTSEGWIGAENGEILHTTNGGETWDRIYTIPVSDLRKLAFFNELRGWAASDTAVFFSTNGGLSWTGRALPTNWDPLQAIAFLDDSVGITFTQEGPDTDDQWWDTGYRTTNGGFSWVWLWGWHHSWSDAVRDYIVVDSRHVWALYDRANQPEYSTDAGMTWHVGLYSPDAGDLAAPDSMTCWLIEDDYSVFRTTDGAASWELNPEISAYGLAFANRDVGCALKSDSSFLTTNGGQSWHAEYTEYFWGKDAALADGAVWVVGKDGTIYHRRPSISATPEPASLLPHDPSLAVYPNPFNPTTRIVLELPRAGRVTLELYDVTGRHVQTLLDEVKAAGAHTVSVDGATLPSGVYFARLQANKATLTKKLLLLR